MDDETRRTKATGVVVSKGSKEFTEIEATFKIKVFEKMITVCVYLKLVKGKARTIKVC